MPPARTTGVAITWSPHHWPPPPTTGPHAAYLTRDGHLMAHGVVVRAYRFSDGQVILNAEDVRSAAFIAGQIAWLTRAEARKQQQAEAGG